MTIKDLKHLIKDLDDDASVKIYTSLDESPDWTLVQDRSGIRLFIDDTTTTES